MYRNNSIEVNLLSLFLNKLAIDNSLSSSCISNYTLVTTGVVHSLLRLLVH